jgi:2-iminobutanoate/2-iminopropanoate deaminase
MIEYPKSADTPVSHLPFSPATRVGDLIFVSGQASVDATGKIVPDTLGEMRRSIENLATFRFEIECVAVAKSTRH